MSCEGPLSPHKNTWHKFRINGRHCKLFTEGPLSPHKNTWHKFRINGRHCKLFTHALVPVFQGPVV